MFWALFFNDLWELCTLAPDLSLCVLGGEVLFPFKLTSKTGFQSFRPFPTVFACAGSRSRVWWRLSVGEGVAG